MILNHFVGLSISGHKRTWSILSMSIPIYSSMLIHALSKSWHGWEKVQGIRVWTDAKATDDEAWIGGWKQTAEDPFECEWFSMKVEEDFAPWLKMRGGNPKRMIAALEFLATIVAMKL